MGSNAKRINSILHLFSVTAHLCVGRRLAEMMKRTESNENFGPCNIKVLHVSNMARAKETADIIAQHLPGVERAGPDPLLNEGR